MQPASQLSHCNDDEITQTSISRPSIYVILIDNNSRGHSARQGSTDMAVVCCHVWMIMAVTASGDVAVCVEVRRRLRHGDTGQAMWDTGPPKQSLSLSNWPIVFTDTIDYPTIG